MGVANLKPLKRQSFELGEDIVKGKGVYLYDDAGTAKIKKIGSQVSGKSTYGKGYYNQLAMIDATRFVVAYRDMNLSSYGYVRIGQINGDDSISWGTAFRFYGALLYYLDVCKKDSSYSFCEIKEQKAIQVYGNNSLEDKETFYRIVEYEQTLYEIEQRDLENNVSLNEINETVVNEPIDVPVLYDCIRDNETLDTRECPFGLSGGKRTRCYKTEERNTWFYCSEGWAMVS